MGIVGCADGYDDIYWLLFWTRYSIALFTPLYYRKKLSKIILTNLFIVVMKTVVKYQFSDRDDRPLELSKRFSAIFPNKLRASSMTTELWISSCSSSENMVYVLRILPNKTPLFFSFDLSIRLFIEGQGLKLALSLEVWLVVLNSDFLKWLLLRVNS